LDFAPTLTGQSRIECCSDGRMSRAIAQTPIPINWATGCVMTPMKNSHPPATQAQSRKMLPARRLGLMLSKRDQVSICNVRLALTTSPIANTLVRDPCFLGVATTASTHSSVAFEAMPLVILERQYGEASLLLV